MEGFHYVNLFATKGIEYLIVIGFLILFILYWRYLNKPARVKPATARSPLRTLNEWFVLAKNAYYHQGHTWALPEDSQVVRVGLDDFAIKFLGKPDKIVLPEVGSKVEQGEIGWQLLLDSKEIPVVSPVDGEVVEVNQHVLQAPEELEKDPYDQGWLFKVKVPRMKTNLRNLLSGKLAVAWMEDTVHRLRRHMSGELGVVLQDGGVPVTGFARSLSPDRWDEIASEFLMNK